MKAGICHVVQRGLDGGHGLMDLRRTVVPSGVMVASTTRKMKIMHILILKMAWWFDGDDGFCSECTRCSLRVYYTG
jgi:hypothetical protein